MTIQELFNLFHEDKIEKTKGQGYLCLLHDSGCVPSLHGDFDAVLMTAGLATVNQMHATLRDSFHEVFSEKGVITKFVPGVKGGEA